MQTIFYTINAALSCYPDKLGMAKLNEFLSKPNSSAFNTSRRAITRSMVPKLYHMAIAAGINTLIVFNRTSNHEMSTFLEFLMET